MIFKLWVKRAVGLQRTKTQDNMGNMTSALLVKGNWICQVSRWFGQCPFDVDGKFSKKLFSIAATTAAGVTIGHIFMIAHQVEIMMHLPNSQFYKSFEHIAYATCGTSFIIAIWLLVHAYLTKRREFEGLYRRMKVLKHEVKGFKRFAMLLILITCIAYAIIWAVTRHGISFIWWATEFLSALGQFHYLSLLGAFVVKLKAINKSLLRHQVLLGEFCRVLEDAKVLNTIYGWALLLWLAGLFTGLAENPIMVYKHFTRPSHPSFGTFMMFSIMLASSHLLLLTEFLLMVSQAHNWSQQVEKFYKTVFQLMYNNETLLRENRLRLVLLRRETVDISANGWFNLGYPLVTSVVAAAATYTVIMMQFL